MVNKLSTAYSNSNKSPWKSLKGGSFAVEFRLPIDTLKAISAELSGFKV
jgi:hypothetical protein